MSESEAAVEAGGRKGAKVARKQIAPPPTGRRRISWLGPGFLWMVSAAGSGELLFTPRIGSLYGYALLWALLLAVTLKWFVNREIGRYAVCTGRNLLAGFARLPGPRGWPIWLIIVPQLLVAVATLAGLAGAAATAVVLALPGDLRWWAVAEVVAATALVVSGQYRAVEAAATALAIGLAVAAVTAAVWVGPDVNAVAAGIAPGLPKRPDLAEILPWLGFALSGAAGMIWYSYWLPAKGYGAASGRTPPNGEDTQRLRGWLRQLTLDNTVAVVGASIIAIAFLILGSELLHPRGLVPEENKVAEVLGRLLGEVWGPVGFWFMVLAVFVGFWGTMISDQDGFGRMFAGGARLLRGREVDPRARAERRLRRGIVIVVLAVTPTALFLLIGEPVALLKVAGAIEAAHIPVVAGLTLYLNYRDLPRPLRPGPVATAGTGLAGLFFVAFTVFYFLTVI